MKLNYLLSLIIAVSACVSLSGCGAIGNNANLGGALSTGLQALTLTEDQIIGYSQQAVAQMDAQANVAPANNAYAQRLARLTKGLVHLDGKTLSFKVYLTPEINAFATADGSVRVYSGIMDVMNDDELLGIIGHELGHVAMQHSLNAMKQSLVNSALLQAVGATGSRMAALTQSQLAQLGSAYLSSKYSRKQENEADDFGYDFLKGARRNPWAMAMAFEKMQAIEAQAGANNGTNQIGSYLSLMFSDHPSTAERIRRMTERAQADGIARPTGK